MYYKDLLRHRQAWLGAALLWIILFHLPIGVGPLGYPKAIGYGGVDICFFASGIGCYYSLTSDSDIGNFMKRRLKRLMPTYSIFIIGWLATKYISGEFDIQMALGNLLALQHFSGHANSFNWYIGAALLFYFFAPYFKMVVDRSSPVCKYLFPFFLFLCSVPFWQADIQIITVSRLPIFYIGMLFANMCQQSKRISAPHVFYAVLSFIVGMLSLRIFFKCFPQHLWSYGLYWYPFIFITPPLCMAISYLLILMERLNFTRPVVSFLSLCGEYSFELYLIHILLISLISDLIKQLNLTNFGDFIWIAGIVPLFAGCFILRRLTLLFNRLHQRIRRA